MGFIPKRTVHENMPISTGIPTLDQLIEIKPGTLTCILESEQSFNHNTMLQIFLSQNAGKTTYAVGKEEKNLVRFIEKPGEELSEDAPIEKKMLIAWRYKDLGIKKTEFAWDLCKRAPYENSVSLDDAISLMKSEKNAFFVFFSLCSPLYNKEPEIDENFFYTLRKWCKLNNHIVYLSVPVFLINFTISMFFDNVLEIHPLISYQGERYFYNCILEIKKISSKNDIRINKLESYKYGVKVKSKDFIVERIEIPPDDVADGSGCMNAF